jgi:ubiquinone biosynthesis protein
VSFFSDIANLWRLFRAGRILARHDALMELEALGPPPLAARLARTFLRIGTRPVATHEDNPLAAALTELGPSYIKLGQFMATRPDVVGPELSREMSRLQDRLPPFAQDLARREIREGLGRDVDELFAEFGPPVAAASIAQVHKARIRSADGATGGAVAVKILRPGVEARFHNDLSSFYTAARLIEFAHPPTRRLRPVAVVDTMARSVELEMDLRLEAAAMSEMAENTTNDQDFAIPDVDWDRTSRRILTTAWIDGIPLNDLDAIARAGIDMKKLAQTVIHSFLRHAMRDGFFHADMHQGNLFVRDDGTLVAVDFGIMGRLSPMDRRFLAEILHGFITRDYTRLAEVHFTAGYVPRHQSVETFAQALRAIGEPLAGKEARDISMAGLLGQLLQVTEQFDMQTQPQLILLQKTMVVVEGVARTLDEDFNMWTASAPVVEEWMRTRLGPEGRLRDAADGAVSLGRVLSGLPEWLEVIARTARTDSTGPAEANNPYRSRRHERSRTAALWVGALALVSMALVFVFD